MERRNKPYLHINWLSSALIGVKQCHWAVWHRVHFNFVKVENDSTKSMLKHSAIVRRVAAKLADKGYAIFPETSFKVSGKNLVMAGSCDLVAIKDKKGLIVEVKSGNKYPSDRIQLLLYMWGLPKSNQTKFRGLSFDGMLIYDNQEIKVSALEIDEEFCQIMERYVKELLDKEPSQKFPSFFECKYCNIANCDERQTDSEEPQTSDTIPLFF